LSDTVQAPLQFVKAKRLFTADKLAVAEALYGYAAGIDIRDAGLMASALTDSAASDFRPAAAKAGLNTLFFKVVTPSSRLSLRHLAESIPRTL